MPDAVGAADPLPVSIFLITLNEADRLPATLDAVSGLAAEVVVVDSGSTDGTVALAQARGARVIGRAWSGFGPQKRFAEEQCRHDWLLNLDADEVASPDLVREIRALFADGGPTRDAYTVPIAEAFPGEAVPHRWAYTLSPVRFYRRDNGRYSPSPVHDRVELVPGASVGRLEGRLFHFSVRSLGDQISKLNAYSDQQAADLDARGIALSPARILFEFPVAFLKAYLLRRHVLRGSYGFLTAMNYAIARHLRIAKHLERRRARRRHQT